MRQHQRQAGASSAERGNLTLLDLAEAGAVEAQRNALVGPVSIDVLAGIGRVCEAEAALPPRGVAEHRLVEPPAAAALGQHCNDPVAARSPARIPPDTPHRAADTQQNSQRLGFGMGIQLLAVLRQEER